jgi:hypothetical protein
MDVRPQDLAWSEGYVKLTLLRAVDPTTASDRLSIERAAPSVVSRLTFLVSGAHAASAVPLLNGQVDCAVRQR